MSIARECSDCEEFLRSHGRRAISKLCWRWLPTISSGSFRARTGRWPATHRGRAELAAVLQKASEEVETTYPEPPEFVAQGDRVLVVGVATGTIKATNKPFKDDWVFDITVRDRKVTKIREYIDTQALARASQMDASGLA